MDMPFITVFITIIIADTGKPENQHTPPLPHRTTPSRAPPLALSPATGISLPMPWTPAQHRLFQAAAHNPAIAKQHGMSQSKAATMAAEGVKPASHPQRLAAALRSKR